MAMSKLAKDQLKFVDPPTDEFKCPICLGILQEPYLTACCGNHFCEACIEKVKENINKCPLCQETPVNGMVNKNLRRKLNELKLYCIHNEAGCKWIGDLGKLEQHLVIGEIKGECQYVLVRCTVSEQCKVTAPRKSITDHSKYHCQYRQFKCEYCKYQSTYLVVTTQHFDQCPKYPVPCPNKCSKQTYQRSQLVTHLASCPEQEVDCTFSEMGCKEKLKRRLLQQHLDTNMLQHQMVMCQAYRSLQQDKKKLEEQVACLTRDLTVMVIKKTDWPLYLARMSQITPSHLVAPIILKVPFKLGKELLMSNDFLHSYAPTYYSPPFYSHPNGYKLKLSANLLCNDASNIAGFLMGFLCASGSLVGRVRGKIYGVSIGLCIVDGDYDDNLKWPFEEKVSITLLNERTDDQHHKIERYFKGNKGTKLLLRGVNYTQIKMVEHEYEQVSKLKNITPEQIANKLWNMYDSVKKTPYSVQFPVGLLKEKNEVVFYFEIAFNIE